jgi:hypothetical protein
MAHRRWSEEHLPICQKWEFSACSDWRFTRLLELAHAYDTFGRAAETQALKVIIEV